VELNVQAKGVKNVRVVKLDHMLIVQVLQNVYVALKILKLMKKHVQQNVFRVQQVKQHKEKTAKQNVFHAKIAQKHNHV